MTTMQQAVHIFKKDVRFLRIEITVLIAVATIFAWTAYRVHAGFAIPENPTIDMGAYRYPSFPMTNLMMFLVHVASILLTVRVIQADPIPGTREFWLTRPYSWKGLIAAKAMFVVACVNLPILLARIAIIVLDGFPLSSNLWGLIWSQALTTLEILVPTAALAAITASLTPFIFSAVILLATGVLSQVLLPSRRPFQVPSPLIYGWIRTSAEDLILIFVGLLVIYIQYRYRKTALSRTLGLSAVAVGLAVYIWMPSSFAMDMQSKIGRNEASSPIQFNIVRPADKFIAERGTFSVTLELPVELKGVPEGMAAVPNWLRVRIESPDPRVIDHINGNYAFVADPPNLRSWNEQMEVPASFLELERGKPLTLHATVFMSLFKKDHESTVTYQTNRWIDIPGGLRCFNGYIHHCERTLTYPMPLITVFTNGLYFVLSKPSTHSPFDSSLALNPVEASNNILKETSVVTVWEHVSDIRREIEIQNFPLTDYVDIRK